MLVYWGITKRWHLPWGESVNINRCCINSHCELLAQFLKVNACLSLKIGHGHFPNVIVNKSESSPLESTVAVSRRPLNVEIWFIPGADHVGILMDGVPLVQYCEFWWTECRWYSTADFDGRSAAGTVLRISHFVVVETLIRAGLSGDRIPGLGARFSASFETAPDVHPAFCTAGIVSLPWR